MIRATPFIQDELVAAYEAAGYDLSGDLDYMRAEGPSGRFFLEAHPTSEEFAAWRFFEADERQQVCQIVGEANWTLTITSSGGLEGVNSAILNLPEAGRSAVHNDWGLVLELKAAQEAARLGIEWIETRP